MTLLRGMALKILSVTVFTPMATCIGETVRIFRIIAVSLGLVGTGLPIIQCKQRPGLERARACRVIPRKADR